MSPCWFQKKLRDCQDEQLADLDISFEHPEPADYTSIGSIQLDKVLAKRPSLSLQSEQERKVMTEIAQEVAARLGHFSEPDESSDEETGTGTYSKIQSLDRH